MTSTIDVASNSDEDLPPRVALPKIVQAAAFMRSRRPLVERLVPRYGPAFRLQLPVVGETVMVTDAAMAKQLFTASPDDVGNIQPNLSRLFGPGSVFALDGVEHRRRRKLLAPLFHGNSIKNYETIAEEETLREIANWPQGRDFETLEPMMRITLNVILRGVFGADGAELDELRRIIPPWVTLGSKMAILPVPGRDLGPWTPWGRLAAARRRYDQLVDRLIDQAQRDPDLERRTDVLALFLRSTYDDGEAMTSQEIADELLTLLAAGHETTASTLAWAFERISRHPTVLAALVAEAATDGNELRQAAILEVQRVRTVIDLAGRRVYAPEIELGPYRVPRGHSIVVSISRIHADPSLFPDPLRFDPQRFVGAKPSIAWIPFGGGTRRCVGAAFANLEMDVVLRTVLRELNIQINTAPGEKWYFRGVAYPPKRGGRVVVHRRRRQERIQPAR
ncbi:MAG: cytochrome P450 [Mycobacterium sp.]